VFYRHGLNPGRLDCTPEKLSHVTEVEQLDLKAELIQWNSLQKTQPFLSQLFLCSCVCPEPVLANIRVLLYKLAWQNSAVLPYQHLRSLILRHVLRTLAREEEEGMAWADTPGSAAPLP
jgi:hypothetical protein